VIFPSLLRGEQKQYVGKHRSMSRPVVPPRFTESSFTSQSNNQRATLIIPGGYICMYTWATLIDSWKVQLSCWRDDLYRARQETSAWLKRRGRPRESDSPWRPCPAVHPCVTGSLDRP
jgi:hypothetical protein